MTPDEMEALLEKQGEVQEKIELLRRLGDRIQGFDRRWMPCAVHPRIRAVKPSPAGRSVVWLFVGCFCSANLEILLLDEPTNHLDAESVQWLEQHLARFPGNDHRGHS